MPVPTETRPDKTRQDTTRQDRTRHHVPASAKSNQGLVCGDRNPKKTHKLFTC